MKALATEQRDRPALYRDLPEPGAEEGRLHYQELSSCHYIVYLSTVGMIFLSAASVYPVWLMLTF